MSKQIPTQSPGDPVYGPVISGAMAQAKFEASGARKIDVRLPSRTQWLRSGDARIASSR